MPPPPATEARSGSLEPGRPSRAGPDQPIRAIPAGRPPGRMYATDLRRRQTSDVRQTSDAHHRLMPPPPGEHKKTIFRL